MAHPVSRRDRTLLDALGWPKQGEKPEAVVRRMERWRSDGLGPLARAEKPQDEAPHWLALDDLAGRGTVADTTAVRLPQRGFTCRRYGDVLRQIWRLAEGTDGEVDPYGDGESLALDLGVALRLDLEETAANLTPLDKLFCGVVAQVRRNNDRGDDRTDSVIADFAALALGGLPIETGIPGTQREWPLRTDSIGPRWDKQDAQVSPWLLPAGPSPRRLMAALVEHYLPEVVAAIPVTRVVLGLAYPDFTLTEQEWGDLCALLAPMQALYVRRTRAALIAWSHTGGGWRVDYSSSSPQLALVADAVRPEGIDDLSPDRASGAVANVSVTPDHEPAERLVLRPPATSRQDQE